jgi:exopolyphosphatase/guanosine-5'-triphosphate,3'-diphosphate pyrophosphatase
MSRAFPRTGIIDIGSNSVRLVVYQGHPRVPATINDGIPATARASLACSTKR